MNNSIYPCLAITDKIAEAADFYIQTFGNGGITQTSPYVIQFQLSGQKFMLLKDGPASSPNAAISFMVISETAEETEAYYHKLSAQGNTMMPLDAYPWSPKYAWVEDKYGVSWQLYTGNKNGNPQKFNPTLMFTGTQVGKAAEAINLYTKLFPQSDVQGILNYGENEGDDTSFVKHAQFKIKGFTAMAMDSSADHGFAFNDAISLVVECDTQEEIDRYWLELTAHGGQEVACGWLTDRYGLSWQIIPASLGSLLKEPERAQRVMAALLKMKKLIISDLENA